MFPRPSIIDRNAAPEFWRSLEERAGAAEFRAQLEREFPIGASSWPSELSRRDFLKLMSASLALAGLAGCGRAPREEIVPYVTPPEKQLPGEPLFYATAMSTEGFARGVLVESHFGRPTKIEGNPDHPESLGATDAITQAAILSLYDPDRSRAPLHNKVVSDWSTFESEWLALRTDLTVNRGIGLALLTEPTTSPTLLREIHGMLEAFPAARWFQHTPLARYDVDATQPDFDFAAADVVLAIGSDCLFRHPASLRYARGFAQRRRVENGRVRLNRFYAMESSPTVTGSLADFRLPASPFRMRVVLDAIARGLEPKEVLENAPLSFEEQKFVDALMRDLRKHSASALFVAGPEQDGDIQRWALAMNARLGAIGHSLRFLPAVRSDGDARAAGSLIELTRALERGEVRALMVFGANPGYTAPADLEFRELLGRAPLSVHVGTHVDETAALCRWHLPENHFLEDWSDLRAYDGTTSIVQPLISPLYATRSAAEILHFFRTAETRGAYELVRETWRTAQPYDFDAKWHRWLNAGTIDGTTSTPVSIATQKEFPVLTESGARESLALTLEPDATMLDGRWANNAWLQELPKPMTHLVWDNAVLVGPSFAAEHALANGDMLSLSVGDSQLDAPVWIMPGQAPQCLTLSLGYGRRRAGSVGNGHGFDAYRIRGSRALWRRDDVNARKLDRRYVLVSTQQHFAMEGRDLVRVISPADIRSENNDRHSLFPDWPRGRYAWGMVIDLSTCLGCNACVVACQAENNIPTVGKGQVTRGREMHWIRVDRYFSGEPANPRFVHQPVPCMHCENAPCELVCPVAATVHSSEGLNDMVYNRCIGTRYCSNNCPYKVRRFNFFAYNGDHESPVYLQKNPNVSVRERGVMEKCTYCVQRINAARIAAEKENRAIRDGEIRTACQQVCPVDAIVFGDLNDPASRVSRRKSEPTHYTLLEELNTRPRTSYLAKIHSPEVAPVKT